MTDKRLNMWNAHDAFPKAGEEGYSNAMIMDLVKVVLTEKICPKWVIFKWVKLEINFWNLSKKGSND